MSEENKKVIKITNPVDGKYVIDKNGRMTWWQLVATDKEVNMELAKPQLWQLKNQKVLFRHFHPYQKDEKNEKGEITKKRHGPVFGYVLDSKIEDDKRVYAQLSIDGYSSAHRELQTYVINGMKVKEEILPMGASINVIEYNDRKDKNIKWLHWEEVSITPFPACKICLAPKPEKIIKKEQKMAQEVSTSDLVETIRVMEDKLTEKTDKLTEISAKVIELEDSVKSKDEEIASLKDEIEYLTTKKELVDSIIGEKKELEDMYKGLPTEVLKNIVEKIKSKDATPQINTETMDESTSSQDVKKNSYKMIKKMNPGFIKEMEAKAKEAKIDLKKLINKEDE